MQSLPNQIRYSNIRPKGYTSQYKQWVVDPMSSNQYWTPNDVIKLQLQLTQGLMDPFRSSIRIDVAVDTTINPMGCLQVDNSAQSFISQMVLTSRGVQIQRIAQYDTLAAYLTDIGFSQSVAQGRDQQGLGMSILPTSTNIPLKPRTSFQTTVTNGMGFTHDTKLTSVCSDTMYPTKLYVGATQYKAQSVIQGQQADSTFLNPSNTNGLNGNIYGFNNTWGSGYGKQASNPMGGWIQQCQSIVGHYGSIRAQYNYKMAACTYPQSNSAYLKTPMVLDANAVNSYPNNVPYTLHNQTNVNYSIGSNAAYYVPNTCKMQGYQTPFSPYYSKGCNQPAISATIPQCGMANGVLTNSPLPIAVKRFYLPLLSSVIGVLIPPNSYQLIPMKTLYNLLLQFTLSPYAMFTSGCQDRNQFDAAGMLMQQPRSWRIIRFQYVLNLYYFAQQAIRQYIQQSMVKGITTTSQGWILGSQYQIPNGQAVRNSWQVNSSCDSLGQVVILFLTNDHLKYSYCRKQFRLSQNVSTFQLKFDTNYYPPQPIQGNAGNPQILDTTLDNSQFYMQLLKSNNFLFNVNDPLPRINRWNFAVNDRCYDPTNTKPMLDSACLNNPNSYQWTNNSVNADTAMGMSSFHQNRYVGRAAYVYSFQPFAHSKQYMVGLDSRKARPFEVIFNTIPQNAFPRDSTMYIFLRHNTINIYGQNGIIVVGR